MNVQVPKRLKDRRGMAAALAILIVLVMGAIVAGAVATTSSTVLVNRMNDRESVLEQGAAEGLEMARATLNATPGIFPAQGFITLEDGVALTGAAGDEIEGVKRWVYVGPSGILSGEYGIYGTAVSIVRDNGGAVAIRRAQLFQESFARFAYFTDIEPSNIVFGGGDQIFGPVHTNSTLKVHSTGATFHSETRTADVVTGSQYGTFKKGYLEHVPVIPMPPTQELTKLRVQAQAGNTWFTEPAGGSGLNPRLRIEFVARDLNNDGSLTGANEGFIRIYRSNDPAWLNARVPGTGMRNSWNCGHFELNGQFVSAAAHPTNGADNWSNALTNNNRVRRCFLGGANELSNGFLANDARGNWILAPGGPYALAAGQPDAAYLVPITREGNINFKGVIFVDGNVTISGQLRGRVTVAATGSITIADDIQYATNPGLGTCNDLLGLFAAVDVIVDDNAINAPIQPNGNPWHSYDDTGDEHIHAIVLALDNFTVTNYDDGASNVQACEATAWGRGCLYLTGGIIQKTRGAVGTTGGTGYLKRYSYDTCGATQPPPYFPTTGHFTRGAVYEVNPVGFEIATFFDVLGS